MLALIVNIVDHFYIGKLYRSSSKIENTLLRLDYFSRFQLVLERSLMPPTDYLIHGNPAEKVTWANFIRRLDFMFKMGVKMDLTDEEHALLKEAQTKFGDVQRLAEDIFAIKNPVGSKVGGEIEGRMDTLAYLIQENLERINVICYKKTIGAISNTRSLFNLENKIYWVSVFLLIAFATIIGLSINRAAHELVRKTKQIETAKQEWEETFDAVGDFITVHDKDYTVIRVNKATAKKFNTTPEALIGKKCWEIFHGVSEPHPLCPHKKTLETGEPAYAELDDPYLGGIFLTATYPLINEKGELYAAVHIVKDITELRTVDQKVRNEAEINKAVLTVAKFISSTMDKKVIIQEVVRITPALVKCDRCVLFLWDNDQNVYLPMACHGFKDHLVPAFKALRFKVGDVKVFDEANKQKTSIVIEDPINSPLMPSELVNTFNIMSNVHTPILSHGKVIGIIGIDYSKEHHIFNPRDIAIVEGIAAQTGIVLQNARLYHESLNRMMELEHRIETIQVMYDIDKNILSIVNRDEILEIAAHMVKRIIPFDEVTIVLVDEEARCFRYAGGSGVNYPKGFTVSFEDTNATEVLRTDRPISRPNIPLEKNLLPFDRQLMEQGFRSDIRVPIKVKGEVVALLNIGSFRVASFTPEHLSVAEKISARLGVAIENARLFSDLQELLINTVKTLVSTIDAKSPWTRGHSEQVTELALILGKEMEMNQKELDNLRLAGLLHDIGKIGTAEYIIDKPKKLTDEEFAIVKEHPLKGAKIIKNIKQFAEIIPAIANHHEKVDGTGYPDKLKNGEIHLFGRILSLADAYDAMTSDRPYRKAPGREKAIEEIKRCAGTQFDPAVVDAFLKVVEKNRL